MVHKLISCLPFIYLSSINAYADNLIMKDGSILKGEVISEEITDRTII